MSASRNASRRQMTHPMDESPSSNHGRELRLAPLEDLSDGRVVSDQSGRALQTWRWHVAQGRHDVVGDPRSEEVGVALACGADSSLDIVCWH